MGFTVFMVPPLQMESNTDANLVLLANFVFEDRIMESLCVMAFQ